MFQLAYRKFGCVIKKGGVHGDNNCKHRGSLEVSLQIRGKLPD